MTRATRAMGEIAMDWSGFSFRLFFWVGCFLDFLIYLPLMVARNTPADMILSLFPAIEDSLEVHMSSIV